MPPVSPVPTTRLSDGPSVGLIVERQRIVLVAKAGEAAANSDAAMQLASLMAGRIAARP